jgi:hypothetical protein
VKENFMKKFIFLFSLFISFLSLDLVSAQTRAIEGSYRVQGTNPGGKGSYHGTADIVKAGDSYRIHWSVGTVYDGVGKLNGNVFQVEWGTTKSHVGTVTYVLQPDGVMKGTWFVAKNPNDLGTEILTPKK